MKVEIGKSGRMLSEKKNGQTNETEKNGRNN